MSECKKCIRYAGCLEKFRIRKLEGYYNEVSGLTEEQYFRDIDESSGCVDYRPYPRAKGKSLLMLAATVKNVITIRFGYIRAHYPYRRAFHLAFFGRDPRARRKNFKRITKWYENELRRSMKS